MLEIATAGYPIESPVTQEAAKDTHVRMWRPRCPEFLAKTRREALPVRRDRGVVLGRPRSTPADVVARVVREHTEGKTAYAIASDLNKHAVPTAQGASAWSQSTVRHS